MAQSRITQRAIQAALKKGERLEIWDDEIRGLHVVITDGGVATFAVRYRANGRQRRYRLGRFGPLTVEQARRRARKALADVAAGRDPVAEERAKQVERPAIETAVAGYLEAAGHRLRPKTIATYREALARFTTWAAKAKVRSVEDLTKAQLAAFRERLVALPKHTKVKGKGNRGRSKATNQRRDPLTVNRELRAVKTCLIDLARAGKLPHVDRLAISDALRALPVDHEQPEYLATTAIEKLLRACLRHDAATFTETRTEHAGHGEKGTTPRYVAIAPFAAFLLLTGMRRGEALAVRWEHVDLNAEDHDGRKVGEIRLPAAITKTHRGRTIGLEVSPGLRRLLAAMKLRAGDDERVFQDYTGDLVTTARARLLRDYGAPRFDWQMLRSTCSTYLTNAPGIFGSASAFMSAKQLGHSVTVAERHYADLLRGLPRDARTLDAAMRIEPVLREIVDAFGARPARTREGTA